MSTSISDEVGPILSTSLGRVDDEPKRVYPEEIFTDIPIEKYSPKKVTTNKDITMIQ